MTIYTCLQQQDVLEYFRALCSLFQVEGRKQSEKPEKTDPLGLEHSCICDFLYALFCIRHHSYYHDVDFLLA